MANDILTDWNDMVSGIFFKTLQQNKEMYMEVQKTWNNDIKLAIVETEQWEHGNSFITGF